MFHSGIQSSLSLERVEELAFFMQVQRTVTTLQQHVVVVELDILQ